MDVLRRLLTDATTIELVDWPDPDVPSRLVRSGYTVLGHEPDGFTEYEIIPAPPIDPGEGRTFPLADGTFLIARPVEVMPDRVDVVSVFRPPAEQLDLLRAAAQDGARIFWIHPGVESAPDLEAAAVEHGMLFVDGVSIVDAVAEID